MSKKTIRIDLTKSHTTSKGGTSSDINIAIKACQQMLNSARRKAGYIVEEVADERLYEFGILTAVGSACPALIAAQDIILRPLDFCVAEAVALHLLDLGIESL
jgi:hypothetical protein